ncbi:HAD family hydrolase [Enterococcus avium]|uniref:HAD family hydrolase n=1 Tax=Enterococcus avium TaxID=33945 RepID=UPI00288FC77F|nr:HAD family hydrolase [Enterococcus avium]MDT2478377.1 HAD family hydrolase [Enterococcus avium]
MTAIIFDIDDTLYDQLAPFKRAFEKHFYSPDIPIEELFKLSRMYSDEVFEESENGTMTHTEMHIYRIRRALEHFDQSITDQQARTFQLDYQINQNNIQFLPEMREAFDICVKHGIQFGIITNGPADHQLEKVNTLQLHQWIPAERIVVSGELGYSKPNLKIFQHAETIRGLDKNTTYYVGDSFVNDVVGAKNAGWKTVWINRRKHDISGYDVSPDYTVDENRTMKQVICSAVSSGNL